MDDPVDLRSLLSIILCRSNTSISAAYMYLASAMLGQGSCSNRVFCYLLVSDVGANCGVLKNIVRISRPRSTV
jgi:hypothetical protein